MMPVGWTVGVIVGSDDGASVGKLVGVRYAHGEYIGQDRQGWQGSTERSTRARHLCYGLGSEGFYSVGVPVDGIAVGEDVVGGT